MRRGEIQSGEDVNTMGEGSMRRSLGQEEKMLKLLFRIVPEEVHQI
jgi:hypothetical protein